MADGPLLVVERTQAETCNHCWCQLCDNGAGRPHKPGHAVCCKCRDTMHVDFLPLRRDVREALLWAAAELDAAGDALRTVGVLDDNLKNCERAAANARGAAEVRT